MIIVTISDTDIPTNDEIDNELHEPVPSGPREAARRNWKKYECGSVLLACLSPSKLEAKES